MKTSKKNIRKVTLWALICLILGGLSATAAWYYCEYYKVVNTENLDDNFEIIFNAAGKSGLRDNRTGEIVLPMVYDNVVDDEAFSFVQVSIKDKWGLYNTQHKKMLVPPSFDWVWGFDQDVALCPAILGDTLYFIDTTGSVKSFRFYSEIIYEEENVFFDEYGYCKVPVTIAGESQYYMVNSKGKVLDERAFTEIELYSDVVNDTGSVGGYYAVADYDGNWGIIDTAGQCILPFEYMEVAVVDRFGYIVLKDGKRLFLGFDGELLYTDVYDAIDDVDADYTLVTVNGLSGMVDSLGRIVISPRWDYLYHFRGNVFCASIGDYMVFLNSKDEFVQSSKSSGINE